MGKIFDFCKKYSFGNYRPPLFYKRDSHISSALSFVFTIVFLLSFFSGVMYNCYKIFIERPLSITMTAVHFNET